jgi:hypothetical protein
MESSPLKRAYYGRLKKIKDNKTGFNKYLLKDRHRKNIIDIQSILWLAAIRYCYYKGLLPLTILKKAGTSISKYNNGITHRSILNVSYFIVALEVEVESLLAWHYQSYSSMQINVESIMKRFHEDINTTNNVSKEIRKLSSLKRKSLKSMPDQGESDTIS